MIQTEEKTGSEVQENKQLFKYCLRCGRRLISVDAQQAGIGKICQEKSKHPIIKKGKLFD